PHPVYLICLRSRNPGSCAVAVRPFSWKLTENCTGSWLGHATSTRKVTLSQAVPSGGRTVAPAALTAPTSPDGTPTKTIVPPPAACQDGDRAPQGAHCCETGRSPA